MVELLVYCKGIAPLKFQDVKELEEAGEPVHKGYVQGDIVKVIGGKGWAKYFQEAREPHYKVAKIRRISFNDDAIPSLTQPLLDEKQQPIQRRRHCLDVSKVPGWKWRKKTFVINSLKGMLIDKDNS